MSALTMSARIKERTWPLPVDDRRPSVTTNGGGRRGAAAAVVAEFSREYRKKQREEIKE